MDGYILQNYGKKSRKNRSAMRILTFTEKLERERNSLQNDPGWLNKIHGMLQEALDQLQWTKVSSLRCLGLGSPSESRSARLQLALILELLSYTKLPPASTSFYDPVFTEEDMKEFEALGLNAINGREALNARHTFSQRTLLVMPHCDIELYKNVLESNWSRERLSMVLVLGNPLDQYLLTTPKERLKTDYLPVQRMANHSYWHKSHIPEATCDDKAFVALAFQYLEARNDPRSEETPFWVLRDSKAKDDHDKKQDPAKLTN